VELLLSLHQDRLLRSAHDPSNGGLAVALAECAMRGVGCHVDLGDDDLDAVALLFSESQGRAIVSTQQAHEVLGYAQRHGVPARQIGRTVHAAFLIERNGVPLVRASAEELARVWKNAFALLLGGDTVDDVIRGAGEAPELIAR